MKNKKQRLIENDSREISNIAFAYLTAFAMLGLVSLTIFILTGLGIIEFKETPQINCHNETTQIDFKQINFSNNDILNNIKFCYNNEFCIITKEVCEK